METQGKRTAKLTIEVQEQDEGVDTGTSRGIIVYGESAEDLGMLGAGKGFLEGLYETAAPRQKEHLMAGFMDKMIETLKPKELPEELRLPRIEAFAVKELLPEVLTIESAHLFRRNLNVTFRTEAALKQALAQLGLKEQEGADDLRPASAPVDPGSVPAAERPGEGGGPAAPAATAGAD
jgi:hypothetical protein